MYAYFNPNPAGKSVGDVGLALEGFLRGDLLNADSVWGPYLQRHGFRRHFVPDDGLGAYTAADFARDNPSGIFVLSMPGKHVVTVVDGTVFDSWDSRKECPSYFWCKED